MYQRGKRQSNKDGFHLSELTGQSIPVVMRILLLIKTIQLDQSNLKLIICTKEMVFHQKLLKKPIQCKMTGPAIVLPASPDFWKAPLVVCKH